MNIKEISPEAIKLFESLIKKYPLGYSISPSGDIYEVIKATHSIAFLMQEYPLPPVGGGYFVAKETK